MNETEYVALIFILKENQKKGKENKKNYSQRKPEQKWENIKKNWKKTAALFRKSGERGKQIGLLDTKEKRR